MAAIIEKQHVAKRSKAKRQKTNFSKPINKSAGFDSGFINHFRQETVHAKTKKRPSGRKAYPSARKRPRGFSFPVPSLATIAVVAGTIVIALAALNWEDIYITVPTDYALPASSENVENQTIRYAATGVTGIMPAQGIITEIDALAAINSASASALTEDTAAQAQETSGPESGPNDLITFEWQEYKVKKGEVISVIAQRFGVSTGAIIASNEISNVRTVREGTVLRIPNIDGIPYKIKNGDSLSKIAASFDVPLEVILDINDIKNDNIKAGETLFIPGARMNDMDLRLSLGELFQHPVPSRYITSSYGMRKDPISGVLAFHTGIDLRANTGTPVAAALDGVVSVVDENWLYGKYIIITHDNGYKTLYAHLDSYAVRRGDRVARGRKIGESGNTGYSTGPHLHFSIYDKNNRLVNPLELLR